jgi:hypothetical protein
VQEVPLYGSPTEAGAGSLARRKVRMLLGRKMRVGVDVEVLGRDTVHHGEGRIGRRGSLVRVAGDLKRHRGRIRVSVGQPATGGGGGGRA